MNTLQSGFARCDITPAMGTHLEGYFFERPATGILDPLYATAVAFDNGDKRGILMSVDNIGMSQVLVDRVRTEIAGICNVEEKAIFIACTHTHLAPCTDGLLMNVAELEYVEFLVKKLCDTAHLAMQDLAPTEMYYTNSRVEDVAFIRRYRMKDGSAKTNPGCQNPDILHPIGEADDISTLIILKREGKPEIGIVHFQVHPDVIGGDKVSADYPKFVRDTYESLIDNSRCIYINGAQGDVNHIDVRLNKHEDLVNGYERSKYMGKKIAMSVIANYPLAKKITNTAINYGQTNLCVDYNRGTPEEEAEAISVYEDYRQNHATYEAYQACRARSSMNVPKACRVASVAKVSGQKELHVTALSIGNVVFAGFPGEPFTGIGKGIKAQSKFPLTLPVCCANGYEGYYPMMDAFIEGGYESVTSRYVGGTAEKLIETSAALVNSL